MKTQLIAGVFALVFVIVGCRRDEPYTVLKSLGGEISYERLDDINDGPRVLTQVDTRTGVGKTIVIPGDVLWCDKRGSWIVGEKAASPRPAHWMDANWDRVGFFILDPSAINRDATSDDEMIGRAVKWIEAKEDFEKAVGALPLRN